ncbi:MAG TPA: hypothetical protein VKQ05_03400 [Gemmatimonadales bacterium]|nr:hypothetical protein [Gemmatimonadales bacterium]
MRSCNTCKGTYPDVQADGTSYFHQCPPLSVAELHAAITAGTLVLTAAQQAQLAAAQTADLKTPPAAGTLSQVDTFLQTLSVTRKNARDENVVVVGKDTAGNPIVHAKADPTGFTEV